MKCYTVFILLANSFNYFYTYAQRVVPKLHPPSTNDRGTLGTSAATALLDKPKSVKILHKFHIIQ